MCLIFEELKDGFSGLWLISDLEHTGHVIYSEVAGSFVFFLLQVTATALIQYARRKGVHSTGVLFIYWLLQTVALALMLVALGQEVANTVG